MSLSADCDRGHFPMRSKGRTAVISTPAELNGWNAQELWDAIARACHGHRVVVIDMTATRICKASAILSLETARDWAKRCGCQLVILPGRHLCGRPGVTARARAQRLPAGHDDGA